MHVPWYSMTLHLGAEMFDVATLPVHDHSHLFLRQGAGLEVCLLLVCLAPLDRVKQSSNQK
jgi:hypothetical protein